MIGEKLLLLYNGEFYYCEVEDEDENSYGVKFYGSNLPDFTNEIDKIGESDKINLVKGWSNIIKLEKLKNLRESLINILNTIGK